MQFRKSSGEYQRLDPNMTPMIDVCFQMILFFIANMRLFSPEGDFSIVMPAGSPRAGINNADALIPIKVYLHANRSGRLAGIEMQNRQLKTLRELRAQVRAILGLDRGGTPPHDAEVQLECDYNLKYEHVMAALTAISGYPSEDNKNIVHMIEKVRFAPPRAPPPE
jgi:biopolymer transport protein ExbD